jgi:hypothetical protein
MNKAIYDGFVVKLPNSQGELEEIGGLYASQTLRRLIQAGAFVYTTEGGCVSVRLESKARGPLQGYWSAYKRIGGRLHKTYIAAAFALDPYNLEEGAQRLLASAEEKLPNRQPPTTSVLCPAHLRQGDPHE